MIEGKVDPSVIVECFDQFSKQIRKRTYIFLDNSPLHRSHEFICHISQWAQRGLIIKYLPPYSPELNLIEILWRFIKYQRVLKNREMEYSLLILMRRP
jgi:transposase